MAALVVAITGGIASGKSTVANLFSRMGVVVVDADVIAREIVEPGHPALEEIVDYFGPNVLTNEKRLDRKILRDRVFEDSTARQMLNRITHPRIRKLLRTRCESAPGSYCLAAIPLLAESRSPTEYSWIQRVLVLDAPTGLQIARLERRDGTSRRQSLDILHAQATREQRLAIASDVIINDGTPQDLCMASHKLHIIFGRLGEELQSRHRP